MEVCSGFHKSREEEVTLKAQYSCVFTNKQLEITLKWGNIPLTLQERANYWKYVQHYITKCKPLYWHLASDKQMWLQYRAAQIFLVTVWDLSSEQGQVVGFVNVVMNPKVP